MDLAEFLQETQNEVAGEVARRLQSAGTNYPYHETVFAEIVMNHMAEIGMTSDPEVCHFMGRLGNAQLRLSGWAVSEEQDELDLFVSLYEGATEIKTIPDSETKQAAEQCLRFLAGAVDGKLASRIDESNDAYTLALVLPELYPKLDQIRIYVLTDRKAATKNFRPKEVSGKSVRLEVMDIERLHRHWAEGKPRDEVVVNFLDVCGGPVPCVYVPDAEEKYDYALTAIPAEALRAVYERFGGRLLEANVRSFLSATTKVNKGIRETLRTAPELFMAFNNGVVMVADELTIQRAADGSPGIAGVKGLQIVNGGQTTASIYFTKKKFPGVDLARARVPAKIIVLKADDPVAEEALISDISKFANSQTAVKQSDLSANKPYHVAIERLSLTTYCPDGVGRWFYERAAGSYNTMLEREGNTPARRKQIKDAIPSSRRITKTDLAKYVNAWEQLPHVVSKGSQKCFDAFMQRIMPEEGEAAPLPTLGDYKSMIAKAILFRTTSALVRPQFKAFQANVTAYTVAVVAMLHASRIDLTRIWNQQDLSPGLRKQVLTWAMEVDAALHQQAAGRMISESAKDADCWAFVSARKYSEPVGPIPELQL